MLRNRSPLSPERIMCLRILDATDEDNATTCSMVMGETRCQEKGPLCLLPPAAVRTAEKVGGRSHWLCRLLTSFPLLHATRFQSS